MEIVIIEKKAFEDFIQTVEYFISRITSMDARTEDKQPEQWLDTADVCAGLQLDRRTVYSLREQGKLPFSQFQHRVYYKAKDVKALADGLVEKSPKSEETPTFTNASARLWSCTNRPRSTTARCWTVCAT